MYVRKMKRSKTHIDLGMGLGSCTTVGKREVKTDEMAFPSFVSEGNRTRNGFLVPAQQVEEKDEAK
jgi:hypothetical protein